MTQAKLAVQETEGAIQRSLPQLVDKVCIETAEVTYHLGVISNRLKSQAEIFEKLRPVSRELSAQNDHISDALKLSSTSIDDARREISASRVEVRQNIGAINELATTVGEIVDQLDRIEVALRNLRSATGSIGGIARQTKLLALNAAIEAQRAGSSGAGFAVVAQEVKALAEQVANAASSISSSLENVSNETSAVIEQGRRGRDLAAGVSEGTHSIGAAVDNFERANSDLGDGVEAIASATTKIGQHCGLLGTGMDGLGSEVTQVSSDMTAALDRIGDLLGWSEKLIAATAPMAPDGLDARLIQVAVDIAKQVEARFEAAIRNAEISEKSLFDDQYQSVKATNPPQFLTRFTAFTDRVAPEFMEPILQLDPKIVSCTLTDRNGYVPTHNLRWSEPQTGDLTHDTARSRNRRIYDDRASLAGARSREPCVLQTYRRDFGDNKFAIMKNLSTPIEINGKNWGAVRIVYQI